MKDLAEDPPVRIRGYLSDATFTSVATVRDIIHEARSRGLLTDTPTGRAGGELTPRAEQMLSGGTSRRQLSNVVYRHLLADARGAELAA